MWFDNIYHELMHTCSFITPEANLSTKMHNLQCYLISTFFLYPLNSSVLRVTSTHFVSRLQQKHLFQVFISMNKQWVQHGHIICFWMLQVPPFTTHARWCVQSRLPKACLTPWLLWYALAMHIWMKRWMLRHFILIIRLSSGYI